MHVLVPVDGSDQGWDALDYALSHFDVDELTVLHVALPVHGAVIEGDDGQYEVLPRKEALERGERLLTEAERRVEAHARGTDVTFTTTLEVGRYAQTIVQYADAHDADHVVMGSQGRTGFSRLVLGSVADTVARRSPVPVTLVR